MVEVLNPLKSMELDTQRTEKNIEHFKNNVQEGYLLLVLFSELFEKVKFSL